MSCWRKSPTNIVILVADSSALIALSVCEGLSYLEPLFGKVFVPKSVYQETCAADKPEALALRAYLEDKVREVDLSGYVYLDAFADAGETEAMVLYKQLRADRLLIDDQRGRKIAQLNQIQIIGSMGVLLRAKKAGLLPTVAPALRKIQQSRVYLGANLIAAVLKQAGETDEDVQS